MLRRLLTLSLLIGIGWFIYQRLRPLPLGETGEAGQEPDRARGETAGTVQQVVHQTTAAVRDAAAKARSAVPLFKDQEGEREVDAEGDAEQQPRESEGGTGSASTAVTRTASAASPQASAPAGPAAPGISGLPTPAPAEHQPVTGGGPPISSTEPATPAEANAGGATTISVTATGATIESAPPPGHRPIKGNIRNDDKIYHMPGDPQYEATRAEQTFQSAEEAEAAGFRRAGRPRESR